MDGENNGKPYEQMDDLGVPYFWKHPNDIKWSKLTDHLFQMGWFNHQLLQ